MSPGRSVRTCFVALAVLVTLAGCSKQAEAPAAPVATAPAASTPAAAPSPARPASQQGMLAIEGTPQPFGFNLFDGSAAGLPLAFSTYVPQDMLAEASAAGATPAVRFVANFGGVRQDRAYVELAFLPAGLGETEALAMAAKSLPGGAVAQPVADNQKRYAWSVREYGPANAAGTGPEVSVALGRHGERWFTLTLHYPPEFSDGFAPRAQHIVDSWRWADTGQGF